MNFLIKAVTSLIMTLLVSAGVSDMAEVSPQQAADDFFAGLTGDNQQVMESYMDNSYINFLENVKGTDEEMDRMEDALFRNFSYEITDSAVKGDVAVCKVRLKNCDFSKVMKNYEKASYKYVTDNLYDENVTDKEKLNRKCLDIYINQIEKASEKDPTYETETFLPMEADGYSGWRIILTDEFMNSVLGGLNPPESK